MSNLSQSTNKNLLLLAMSVEDYLSLQPHLALVRLERGLVLVPADAAVDHVYFPEGGVVSIVSDKPGKGRAEVGMFGLEGMSATFLLLGAFATPHEAFVQVPAANALRIETARFIQAVNQSETLRTTLLRYVQTLMIQTAQSAATNAKQLLEARLARWLLMRHDREEDDEIAVTHQALGKMIAAQRSGVTICLNLLEGEGVIQTSRGRIIIRDRAKLLNLAADGYGLPEAQYSELLVPFGK